MADEKKETIWTKLAAGELPSMELNTNVGISVQSMVTIGLVLFITAVLISVSFFAIKKRLS